MLEDFKKMGDELRELTPLISVEPKTTGSTGAWSHLRASNSGLHPCVC